MNIFRKISFLLLFVSVFSFSQESKVQYFFINEKDSLIAKIVDYKGNMFGYKLIDEKSTVKKVRPSSKINGDDIEYDSFDEFLLIFSSNNDTIVNETYFKNIKIIKSRREFINKIYLLDEADENIILVELIKCKKYRLRKVRLLILE